ncbi:MAG: hypothetical protein HY000_34320 [Planctomycetes bacterium]|nr:hypothetical protein [Planctomycetota bacterium]
MPPALLTFDIFGTVVDWRTGLRAALRELGHELTDEGFEQVINAQAEEEPGPFRSYREITANSLISVLGIEPAAAHEIAANIGRWPLFSDSRDALLRLMRIAPCAAMTNSDRVHGEQVQKQLGFRLTHWICAEDVRLYKPAPEFWEAVAARTGIKPSPDWWHVSAYADYDLGVASRLGMTCVFVRRPHSRPEPAAHTVDDLAALPTLIEDSAF